MRVQIILCKKNCRTRTTVNYSLVHLVLKSDSCQINIYRYERIYSSPTVYSFTWVSFWNFCTSRSSLNHYTFTWVDFWRRNCTLTPYIRLHWARYFSFILSRTHHFLLREREGGRERERERRLYTRKKRSKMSVSSNALTEEEEQDHTDAPALRKSAVLVTHRHTGENALHTRVKILRHVGKILRV